MSILCCLTISEWIYSYINFGTTKQIRPYELMVCRLTSYVEMGGNAGAEKEGRSKNEDENEA